jgi:ATP-dependent DNA ligase I
VTLLAELVRASQRVGSSTARRAKVQELAWLLKSLAPDEVAIGVHYLSGEIPQGKIGIGYAAVRAAAATPAARLESLSIVEADRRLAQLADVRGAGSGARRAESLQEFFSRSTRDEQQFVLRLLIGELRQGALAGVMVDAIAAAADLPAAPVRRAAMYAKNLGEVAAAAFAGGVAALDRFQLEVFSPVAPMLAQTAADVAEALQEMRGAAAFEWKMDGARIQLHKRGGEVRIYTRSLNEISAAIPEIAELAAGFPQHALVLDGEAIAFDAARRPQPFQVTMRRFGRKLNVEALRNTLPIEAFFFDCLRIGDDSIATRSTQQRYEALTRAVPPALLIPRLVTDSEPQARAFYEAAIAAGHEGVMVKALDAPYEAGNRGASWFKIKRIHTLDLVVLGAEWGNGRRTGKLSNLHLGARDPASGEYIMLGKTFKGLTDAMLAWQTGEFLKRETRRDSATVYIRPELVVEIAFSDLQASSRYPGGVALRLARVKRYRDDKRAEEADTMDSVRQIFAAQSAAGA